MPATTGARFKVLYQLRTHEGEVLTVDELAAAAKIPTRAVQGAMSGIIAGSAWPVRILAQGKMWHIGPFEPDPAPVSPAPVSPAPEPPRAPRPPLPVPLSADEPDPPRTDRAAAARAALAAKRAAAANGTTDRHNPPARTPKAIRYTTVDDLGTTRILRDPDGYLWTAKRIGLAED